MAEVGCTYFLNSGLVMLADASGDNLSAAVLKTAGSFLNARLAAARSKTCFLSLRKPARTPQ